jgi:hypothetical protein
MSDKKYELTDEKFAWYDYTLRRIRALKDFELPHADKLERSLWIKAGELGGWVEGEHNLSQDGDCWVDMEAKVFGNGRVFGSAYIGDVSQISDNASVTDSLITDETEVYGHAVISGLDVDLRNSRVCDSATIRGTVFMEGETIVSGNATIDGEDIYIRNSVITGSADLFGTVQVIDSWLTDHADVCGDTLGEVDNDLNLISVVIGGNAKIRTATDFLLVTPLASEFHYPACDKALYAVPLTEVSPVYHRKGEIWRDVDTVDVTFYKTVDPNMVGVSVRPLMSSLTISAGCVISDPVFYLVLQAALVKFGFFDLIGKIQQSTAVDLIITV